MALVGAWGYEVALCERPVALGTFFQMRLQLFLGACELN